MVGKSSKFDVIIIGGGPAGLAASLWCSEVGLNALLVEKAAEFGGQLLHTYNPIRNYPGIEASNGRELRDLFFRQIENGDVKRLTQAEILRADLAQKTVTLADDTVHTGQAIIIATGTSRRRLGVPGEEQLRGRGILESGVKAKDEVQGKVVLIAGGGDAAFENALILGGTARKVLIVHRRAEFSARREFIERVRESKNIHIFSDTQITGILGRKSVEGVELMHLTSEGRSKIGTDLILVRIGVEPNTDVFRGQIEVDASGYVVVDCNCATSLQGVFAVGDVGSPVSPTISSAAGQGATAVKAILRQLNLGDR